MSDKALKNQNQGAIKLFLKIKLQSAVGTEISLAKLFAKRRLVSEGQSRPRFHFQFIETVSEWLPGLLRTKSSGFKPFNVLRDSKRSRSTAKSKASCGSNGALKARASQVVTRQPACTHSKGVPARNQSASRGSTAVQGFR